MAQEVLGLSKNMFRSLDSKIVGQLNTVLQVGAKKIEKSTVEMLLATQVANELSQNITESYSSVVNISSSFLFERLAERLQVLLDKTINLTKKIEEPATPTEIESSNESDDQLGSIRRLTLSESALGRSGTKKRNRQSRKISTEEASTIPLQTSSLTEFLAEKDRTNPEVEEKKTLVHLTKNRVTPSGNRKRPTRKATTDEDDLEANTDISANDLPVEHKPPPKLPEKRKSISHEEKEKKEEHPKRPSVSLEEKAEHEKKRTWGKRKKRKRK